MTADAAPVRTWPPAVLSGEGGGSGEGGADRGDGEAGGRSAAPLRPSGRVPVAFSAPDCGEAELTWGQYDMWRSMVGQNSWLPLGGSKRLEPGTRIEDVAEELRYLMTRFPALRTRLRFRDGERPVQVLSGSGETALELFDADGDVGFDANANANAAAAAAASADTLADPSQRTADAVEAQYRSAPFYFAEQWPMRMALVLRGGEPTHLVAITCHLALDAAGARVMLREVADRTTAPPTGLQPLDQARWQGSPAGLRQNAAALRYWENLIRSVPPRRVGPLGAAHTPVRWCAQFTSRALQLGVEAIAARVGADSSVVLLAVYATALARITGVNPVVTRPLVSNRFRPGLAEIVCTAVQGGILALDVADVTVDEAVRRTQRTVMTAYKYAYYDPEHLDDLIARAGKELPPGFEIRCFFNDRRGPQPDPEPPDHPADPGSLPEAREHSDFRWTEKSDEDRDENLFVHIDETAAGIVLTVCAHTGYFGPERIEALARGMEQVAISAALDPAVPTLVSR